MCSNLFFVSLFSFTIIITDSAILTHPKLDLIKTYDIITVNADFQRANHADPIRLKEEIVFVRFYAYERSFKLSLLEDRSIFAPNCMVHIHEDDKIAKMYPHNIPGSSIFEGTVEGEEKSSVNGYFYDNIFTGKIIMDEQIYYLEPAFVHLNGEIYRDKVMIYKEKDVLSVDCVLQGGEHVCEKNRSLDDVSLKSTNNLHSFNESEILKIEPMAIERNLRCRLEIMADHTFVAQKRNDRSKIIAEMTYHIKSADKIFRLTDMDEDSVAEDIGFLIEKITIFSNKNQPGYALEKESSNSDTVFRALAKHNSRDFCLLVAFTYRDFDGGVIGKAYVPNPPRGVGGICSRPFGSENVNINLITILNRGRVLPAAKITICTTHELGHSFGTPHDPTDDPICAPSWEAGFYIMYPAATDGDKANNWRFSVCSRKKMHRVVVANGRCMLKKPDAVCGNAMTEEGEECDCGQNCNEIDKCCTPVGSRNECTLKSGVQCSPREGDCCTDDCTIVPASRRAACFINLPCRESTSTCDGTSPFCPERFVSDGTLCRGTTHTCFSGTCRTDVCNDHKLQLCQCSVSSGTECHICCLDNSNRCLSVRHLNIPIPNKERYIKVIGTPCNNNRGTCRSNGTCSTDEPEAPPPFPRRPPPPPTWFRTIRPPLTPRRPPTVRRWNTWKPPPPRPIPPGQPPRPFPIPPGQPPRPFPIPPGQPPRPFPTAPPPPPLPPRLPPLPQEPKYPDSGDYDYYKLKKLWPFFLPLPILILSIIIAFMCSSRK